MLVYANHLTFEGTGAEEAIFKGIGAWIKSNSAVDCTQNNSATTVTIKGPVERCVLGCEYLPHAKRNQSYARGWCRTLMIRCAGDGGSPNSVSRA